MFDASSASLTIHFPISSRNRTSDVIENDQAITSTPEQLAKVQALPLNCPGCGAPSQISSPSDAGFYTLTRQGLRKYIHEHTHALPEESLTGQTPICDRCHNLLHHSVGNPIFHPSITSINRIISASPHKHNTIYHVLDAADLPMSLIPSLQQDLRLPRLRSQNRRSKHTTYSRGRVAEVFFIITRADLLAPKKEQVDALLPYIRELLRDALGRESKNVRLGNVRCVSAKRGWWTKPVKEEIWDRGGAGWMVGKVNVGKSSLFEVVFPKGRSNAQHLPSDRGLHDLERASGLSSSSGPLTPSDLDEDEILTAAEDADASLLPPAQPESPYPIMPITSSLPGTTASPIRVPFGAGKGELIDLPGVARSSLSDHVTPSAQSQLIMSSRISPDQVSIKPGQSLLLGGGLVRITNPSEKDVILAYPFVPLASHVTSTAKAEELERGARGMGIENVVTEEARGKIKGAGKFEMRWDVTKARAGPLTRRDAVGLKAERLPFVVWSADVVVEGVGWVELVCQRRRREMEATSRRSGFQRGRVDVDEENPFPEAQIEEGDKEVEKVTRSIWPEVEVFSPEGKFVMARRPMGAWLLAQKVVKKTPAGARQRRSMKSVKMSDEGRVRAKERLS
ncbi:Arginyl-tRNA--protein transferase 1 isoform B [Elsinoe australis]|uniref:Arginyl-tRNA--protein transferase 1 isoform B n=1 Tax=Elsinoe australis TaxID=40998 RepID=A0A2P7YW15_9PEZI|nr:Arginyl-tRNA--protein transferase 1 isoform B [Elsinoe australis]